MEVNPLNIFFVKSDSKGDRLLFRYPYTTKVKDDNKEKKPGRNNPYAINIVEDLLQNPQQQTSNIYKGQLSGFTDEMLSTLFAVKAELCNRKFELKVNDVRFVGHPTLLPYRSKKDDTQATILINIVFALKASASHSIVKCYYDLSKRLGKALRHEEKRCSYLTEEMKIMLAAHDEVSALGGESTGDNEEDDVNCRYSVSSTTLSVENGSEPKSPFHLILQRSTLARSMKAVFKELCSTGIVHVRINKWVLLSFCLPHKAHQIHNRGLSIEPETIDLCLQKLKPYHGMLLMVNPNDLLASIPLDGSQALLRLIKLYSPLKSLQTLAIETDLMLTQVFQLAGHLVYWAKATVIYPLCEGNVYVVAPAATVHNTSQQLDEFAKEFPGLCLLQVLAKFSLPAPLWYHARGGAGGGADVTTLPRVVAWLLRRRLLMQLHTYVQFNGANWGRDEDGNEYFCEKHNDVSNQSCNLSYTLLNHINLNVPEPVRNGSVSNPYTDSEEDYPTENNLNQTDFSHTKPIIIESENVKYDSFNEADSANYSFEDGVDVVDGPKPANKSENEEKLECNDRKTHANSVDSGISSNINGANDVEATKEDDINKSDMSDKVIETEKSSQPKTPTKRLSDLSIKDSDSTNTSSDSEKSPKQKTCNGVNGFGNDNRSGISLNLKLQNDINFQSPTVWSGAQGCDATDSCRPSCEPPQEQALDVFTDEERALLANVTTDYEPEDLLLLAQLHKKGYFRGEQHLEEIMFMEHVTRSQLMQLLDKFKDVLITFETEDPAVNMLYPYH